MSLFSMATPKLCDKWNCLHVNGVECASEARMRKLL